MKQINTVGGIILNENGEILCTQRDASKYDYISYKWEFPGGKVEEGETNEQTLKRELQEELNIEVSDLTFFYQVEHDYPDFHLSMPVYVCKLQSKNLTLLVHKNITWLKPEHILELDWAGADVPVAQAIFNKQKEFK